MSLSWPASSMLTASFMGPSPAPLKADAFVHGLIISGKTHFFLAREAEGLPALGFVHLMPSISTVAMRPIWLLEDLYRRARRPTKGVATALMTYAENFARETGAERLTLATAHDNRRAQSLYKRMGYVSEEHSGTTTECWTSVPQKPQMRVPQVREANLDFGKNG